MEKKYFYTLEEVEDRIIGPKGSEARDKYEADMQDFLVGLTIRKVREEKNMTQEQLGVLMGVKRAQVSRIENGKSLSLDTIRRAFKALGVESGYLDMEKLGKVALW